MSGDCSDVAGLTAFLSAQTHGEIWYFAEIFSYASWKMTFRHRFHQVGGLRGRVGGRDGSRVGPEVGILTISDPKYPEMIQS